MRDLRLEEAIDAIVAAALAEDAADQDLTTLATVPADARGTARLIAREACTIAGLDAFRAVFTRLGGVEIDAAADDGDDVAAGATVATLRGSLRSLLTGERTALNLLQHLSGIATQTRRFVEAAPDATIRDTRKTTPGLRILEKVAVAAGGGTNHRMSLADQILIKDNHIAVAGSVRAAVEAARASARGAWIEVECDALDQLEDAIAAGADEILLDNMSIEDLTEAVRRVSDRVRTEASGGITLETIAAVAGTGVHAISIGALTHSAPSIDLSLEVEAD